MNILATYRTHKSVEDMDKSVENHIYYNADKLPKSNRDVLNVMKKHALEHTGACKLKISTIAKEANCSEATVSRAIKRLKDLHVIEVVKGTKKNGIQGANIYRILNFTKEEIVRERERKVTERVTHETPRSSKVEHVTHETVSFNSFKTVSNPFVEKNVVNNVNACAMQGDLKSQLRAIYSPSSVDGNHAFDELCKIAFGRLKQFMRTHNMPYLQMEQIVLNCMKALVNKQGVRNQFAMYSKMIERQTLQLFEKPIEPVKATRTVFGRKVGVVPEWFTTEKERQAQGIKEQSDVAQMSINEKEDFERRKAELQKRIAQM